MEYRRISRRIDKCLRQVIVSNLWYTKIITGFESDFYTRQMIDRVQIHDKRKSSATKLDMRMIDPYMTSMADEIPPSPLNRTETFIQSEPGRHDDWHGRLNLAIALSKQIDQLYNLISDKEKIWPPNRNLSWALKMREILTGLYIKLNISMWISTMIFCTAVDNFAIRSLAKSKFGDENYRKVNFQDRIWCADHHFYVYVSAELFYVVFPLIITSILDQVVFLKSFEPKLYNISMRLERLYQWFNNIDASVRQNFHLTEQTKKDLQAECDKEAIELYVSYQLFRDEIKSAIAVVETAAHQIVIAIALTVLPTLAFYKDLPKAESTVLFSLIIMFVLMVDGSLALCAALHAACCRVAKLAWTVVALFEWYNYNQYLLSKKFSSKFRLNEKHIGRGGLFSDTKSKPIIDFEFYSHGFVTPHTMLLWRKLVTDYDIVTDDFVCKLYGNFRLNWIGILKLNYWLITFTIWNLTRNGVLTGFRS